MRRAKGAWGLLAVAVLLVCGAGALAATDTWDGDTDINWDTGGNWADGTAPAAADDAVIDTSTAGLFQPTITGGDAPSLGTLTFDDTGDGAITITITDDTLTVTTGVSVLESAGTTQTINGGDGGGDDVFILGDAVGGTGATITINSGSDLLLGGNLSTRLVGSHLTVTGGNDLTINGTVDDVGGTYGIIKNGGGVLSLNADNTTAGFAGGVTLNAGTLSAGDNDALGTGALTVGGNTALHIANGVNLTAAGGVAIGAGNTLALDVDNGETGAIAGVVSGAGAINITDTGTFTLAGANTFSGGTTLSSAATVNVGNSSALGTGGVDVNAAATLNLDNGVNLANALDLTDSGVTLGVAAGESATASGVISGGNGLTYTGGDATAALTLSGANTFTGGTTLNSGVLDLANDSALGTGNLTLGGPATVRLSGVTIGNNIADGGNALTLSGQGTLGGVLSGTGGLTLNAPGQTITLSGANTFTGNVGITSGTLDLTGTLADGNNVTITDNTGTYRVGADDTINALDLDGNDDGNAGTVSVAAGSTLTLNAASDLSDGLLSIFANGDTQAYGAINADAAGVTLDDDTKVQVQVTGTMSSGTQLIIIDADANAITNELQLTTADVSDNALLVDFLVDGAADNLVALTAQVQTASSVMPTATDEQRAIIDGVVSATGQTGLAAGLQDAVFALSSDPELQAAADQLGTPSATQGGNLALAGERAYRRGQSVRTGDLRLAMAHRLADGPVGPCGPTGAVSGSSQAQVWANTFGTWGDQNSRGGHSGYEWDTRGLILGMDRQFNRLALGVSMGHSYTDADFDHIDLDQETDAWNAGVYGTYLADAWYLEGGLDYGRSWTDGERGIRIGAFQATASSDNRDADTYTGYLGGGYEFASGNWTLTPQATLTYAYYDQEAYEEEFTDGTVLYAYEDMDQDSFTSRLGLEIGYAFTDRVTGTMRGSWVHEYCDNQGAAKSRFGTNGAWQTTHGLDPADDSYLVGAGVEAHLQPNVVAYADYTCELKDDATAHDVGLGLRIAF